MATLTVTKANLFTLGYGVGWLGGSFVVTVTTAAAASFEILDVVQLLFQVVGFLYVPHKGVRPPMVFATVAATVVGILQLLCGVGKPESDMVAESRHSFAMDIASHITKVVNLFHEARDSKHLFRHTQWSECYVLHGLVKKHQLLNKNYSTDKLAIVSALLQ